MWLAWDPDGPALGKEREGVREARIKTKRSNPLKLTPVCLSEWIYLSQMPEKLALKWFWWQTRPGYLWLQTPKCLCLQNSSGRAERDSGVRKNEGEREHTRYGKIIREVRLGRIRKPGQENWRKYWKEIKYVRRQTKRARLLRTSSTVEIVELWVTPDKDFSREKKKIVLLLHRGGEKRRAYKKNNRERDSSMYGRDIARREGMMGEQKKKEWKGRL